MKSNPQMTKIPNVSKRVVNEHDLISNRLSVMQQNIRNYGSYYGYMYNIQDNELWLKNHEGDAIDYILQHYVKRIHADEILEDFIKANDITVTKTYIGNDLIKLYPNHMNYVIEQVINIGSFGVIEQYHTENVEDACLFFTQLIEVIEKNG